MAHLTKFAKFQRNEHFERIEQVGVAARFVQNCTPALVVSHAVV
jgi:hypothetical protein